MNKKEIIAFIIIALIAIFLFSLGGYEDCLESRGYTEDNAPESVKYNCAL